MKGKIKTKRNILIMLTLMCGIFMILGISMMNMGREATAQSIDDGLITDNYWDEELYVNYDMTRPENVSRNSVIVGTANTNGVNPTGLEFVKTINHREGNHYRGTSPLRANSVIVYVLKNPVNAEQFSTIEFEFYTFDKTFDLSFFSSDEKNIEKANSKLNVTVTGKQKVSVNSSLFTDNTGKVKNITILVNSGTANNNGLYLDGIVLRTGKYSLLGASIRLNQPTGLGFASSIDINYYNRLKESYGESNIRTGTLITRRDFVENPKDLSIDTVKKIDILNNSWLRQSPAGKYYYRGSVVEIPEKHYVTEFVGRGYIKITVDNGGTTKTLYIYNEPIVRTISQVANLAYNDTNENWTEEQEAILKQYSGGTLIENGQMNYSIVIPASPTPAEETAGTMLSEKIAKSCNLISNPQVIKEHSGVVEKGIYVGDTDKKPLNMEIPVKDESYIVRKDYEGNIYIRGNTSRDPRYEKVFDRGTLYGVYDFLEKYFGYRFLNVDENKEIIETYNSVQELHIMDIKEESFSPSIDIRAYSAYNINFSQAVQPYSSMLRHNTNLAKNPAKFDYNAEKYGYTHHIEYYAPPYHNSYDTLVAGVEKYNEQNPGANLRADQFTYILKDLQVPDVCMERKVNVNGKTVSSLDIITLAIKEKIKSSYGYTAPLHYYVYGQEDSHDYEYCECNECKSARATYGGASGQNIHFCNEIIRKLESDNEFIKACPDFKIVTFAYSHTKEPPTVASVKADDKLIIRLALHQDDYYGFDTAENNETQKRLNDWQSHLGGGLMLWIYDSDFQNYAGYYPTINRSIADNVKSAIDHNAEYIMVNASGALNDWDSELRLYIYSKMMYNFDNEKYVKDAEGYVRELAEEYVNGYFGANNVTGVMNIIDKYQRMYAGGLRNFSRRNNNTLIKDKLKNDLKQLNTDIDKLINNESNLTYKKRLKLIKISVLADLYDTNESYIYKNELRNLCSECNFTQWSEGLTVTQKLG